MQKHRQHDEVPLAEAIDGAGGNLPPFEGSEGEDDERG